MSKLFLIIFIGLAVIMIALAVVNAKTRSALAPFDEQAQSLAPFDYITLSHGPVHYRWQGPEDGPVVVMVHGFSTPMFIFEQNAEALIAAGYRVLRFDHFGRGWSARPNAAYDRDFYDTTLLELLDQLAPATPIHLMGLSMGGIISAEFAARHPERVRSLTLFVPAGLDIQDMGFAGQLVKIPILGTYIWNKRVIPSFKTAPKQDDVPPSHRLQGDVAVQYGYRGTSEALRQTLLNLPMSGQDDRFRAVAAHQIPTLAIFGADDLTVPISSAGRLAEAMPEAQIEVIAGGEHTVNFDHFPEVNTILMKWIKQR